MKYLERFDTFQQRHHWLAVPMAVIKKSSDDQGGNLAALVAYYGFFSLFPLLLVFATIVGFILAGHPGDQQTVQQAITQSVPVGRQHAEVQAHLGFCVIALVLGRR